MAEKTSFANLTEEVDRLSAKKSIKQIFFPVAYELVQHGKHMRQAILISKFLRFLIIFYLLVNMSNWLTFDSWLLTPVSYLLTYTNTRFIYTGFKSSAAQTTITIALSAYYILSVGIFVGLNYFKPHSKKYRSWYKYFAINLSAIAPVVNCWANIAFADEIFCERRASIQDCLKSSSAFSWSFAVVGFVFEQVLNIIIWNFMYINSEVLNYPLNGQSKFVTILNELERIIITLFAILFSVNTYQHFFMLAILALFAVKMIVRLRNFQYYDYKLSKYCLFLDTVLMVIAIMNLLIYLDRTSLSPESLFVGFCFAGVIAAYYIVYFYGSHMVNKFRWINDPIIDAKTYQKQVSNFILLIHNYKTSTQMRLKLWNIMHQHKTKCPKQSCACHDIPMEHISSGLGEFLVDKGLYEFLTSKVAHYIETQEMRMDLQLSCSMILLLKLRRFNTVTRMMKQIKGLKATSSQTFQIFILE
jgi:hypothetical protein